MNQKKAKESCGLWDSPIKSEHLAKELRFSDVLWDSDGKTLVWREERSDRDVLVRQNFDDNTKKDLTEKTHSVRAKVGYGGGDFTLARGCVYFVSEGSIFRQELSKRRAHSITPRWGQSASPSVSPDGNYLVYIHSSKSVDLLSIVDSEGAFHPSKLSYKHDFYMQPCWHPGGTLIAWISWNHPNMPWDGSALYLGQLSSGQPLPHLTSEKILDGSVTGDIALFQPCFSPDGRYLSYSSNESGWSNLYLLDLTSGKRERLLSEEAEYGLPAWLQGLRTHCWAPDSRVLYLLRLKNGFTSLIRLNIQTRKAEQILGEVTAYTHLKQISCSPVDEQVAVVASSPKVAPRVIITSSKGKVQVCRSSTSQKIDPRYLSLPKAVRFPLKTSADIDYCYGLLYLPANPKFNSGAPPPAIINIHGGPTSQYVAGYHAETNFFTSRGFVVLELNYRGSSGYGRSYTEVLKGKWGVLDVEDTRAAANYLITQNLADAKKLILMGGSAGGYTLLMSLIAHPGFFKAAVCRYGVSNLLTLSSDTHKFEQCYLESLIGPLPDNQQLYRERSPIFLAEKIQDSVAIFQGEDDQVVPMAQSEEIVRSLQKRRVSHIYRVYPEEGHGWRKKETIHDYYQTVESFLRKQVG